jgi:hypothetical protein
MRHTVVVGLSAAPVVSQPSIAAAQRVPFPTCEQMFDRQLVKLRSNFCSLGISLTQGWQQGTDAAQQQTLCCCCSCLEASPRRCLQDSRDSRADIQHCTEEWR